jgi:hypothetical protein
MSNELAREEREIEEAEKKTDERSALRRSEIASAAARWPDKTIRPRPYEVRVSVKSGFSPIVYVYGPTGLNEKEQQKLARTKWDEMKKTEKFAAIVPSSSGSDSDGGSRRGYRSRRRSRRRGRKLRKQTRKH